MFDISFRIAVVGIARRLSGTLKGRLRSEGQQFTADPWRKVGDLNWSGHLKKLTFDRSFEVVFAPSYRIRYALAKAFQFVSFTL